MSAVKKRIRSKATPRPTLAEPAHPRPQLQRDGWVCLDGDWQFALDLEGRCQLAAEVDFAQTIRVPFAPETPASGIQHPGFIRACWYRRTFDAPELTAGNRLILHFGAVDYAATVWVNGRLAVRHEGGYTPFSADITDLLTDDGPEELVVLAEDDPHDMCKPRGKQDWLPEPHSIWYYRTTGIWQTVWMETVPATHIGNLRWTPDVTGWNIDLEARLDGPLPPGTTLRVTLTSRGKTLADDVYTPTQTGPFLGDTDVIRRRIVLPDPGIGDGREFLFWWPHRPTLIDAEITLLDGDDNVLDTVRSYTAMRSASILGDRFLLNGSPYQLMLVLNQGYWPDGGLTAPSDDAFRRDVELVKQMGFNGVRMHQKIEHPRFLYWADKLGLCVWEEMPSAYAFSERTVERVTREWTAAIDRDISHPCIVAWVTINESWGVPDLPEIPAQRHFVQSLYHLTKSLDPTRPVIGNDGWEMVVSDIIAIHDYDREPARIERRYAQNEQQIEKLFKYERPGGRVLLLDGLDYRGKPIMLTEFGGIAYSRDRNGTWGYTRAESAEEYAKQYDTLMTAVRGLPLFAGFCYTQFTDTYQEANGLLFMDRTPKFPLELIAIATRGAHGADEEKFQHQWRRQPASARRRLRRRK